MDDETHSVNPPGTQPTPGIEGAAHGAALIPAVESSAGGRGLRDRATAGAAALGAAALLVLSFGPAALALSPSDAETAGTPREDQTWVAPLPAGSALVTTPPRSDTEGTEA